MAEVGAGLTRFPPATDAVRLLPGRSVNSQVHGQFVYHAILVGKSGIFLSHFPYYDRVDYRTFRSRSRIVFCELSSDPEPRFTGQVWAVPSALSSGQGTQA